MPTGDMTPEEFKEFQNNLREAIGNTYTVEVGKILTQKELLNILPFKKTKLQKLLQSGVLPVVKVGRNYITTREQIDKWLEEHLGTEIIF